MSPPPVDGLLPWPCERGLRRFGHALSRRAKDAGLQTAHARFAVSLYGHEWINGAVESGYTYHHRRQAQN